ncbi:ATPase [Luteimicrobium album]|uniref:ATPase n=1 Tax=Luteimicrobium album TaxID=1054550 RepID=A0ABQ6I191_9MICO|nr:SRPBCC domain-containing protein [Luteimicrobium album]GMA23539.1 ATPase [Luteimicrobium album]
MSDAPAPEQPTPSGGPLSTVARTVDVREEDGALRDEVVLAITLPHDIDAVWPAVTEASRISSWFVPVSGDLADGGHYQLEGNASGTVLDCRPPHRFRITWEFGDETSWVTVGLEREESESGDDDATRLTLSHLLPRAPQWDAYGPGAVGIGWDLALVGLVRYLATRSSRTAQDATAWLASPDGVAFVRHSGREWGHAHAASGVEEGAALAAAGRTVAAYLGEPGS